MADLTVGCANDAAATVTVAGSIADNTVSLQFTDVDESADVLARIEKMRIAVVDYFASQG